MEDLNKSISNKCEQNAKNHLRGKETAKHFIVSDGIMDNAEEKNTKLKKIK